MTDFRQVTPLPGGFVVTFHWPAGGVMSIGWEPSLPRFRTSRAARKFRKAYNAARREFVAAVATSLGGAVLIADIDGPTEVVRPQTKQ
jgi:hypothetical protein